MANINHLDMYQNIQEQSKLIGFDENPEVIYSQMLTVPFGPTEDGSRALIAGHQYLQLIPLSNPETPIIGTGMENRFGDRSNSIIQAQEDYTVFGKVSKFSNLPNQHYNLIVLRQESKVLDMIDIFKARPTLESYGVVYNTELADNYKKNDVIKKGSIIRKSIVYDEYMNRCDGTNLRTAYICLDENTEDAVKGSVTARRKLTSPLVHKITVMKNSNDIFLNTMGDYNNYKSFPDVGEKIQRGILVALRKVIIKEALYMQSREMLGKILMSDDKFTVTGDCTVVDINIYVNDPAKISQEFYDAQLLYYYNESMRYIKEFVSIVEPYRNIYKFSYALESQYCTFKKILNGSQFMKEKKFSDLMIEFIVVEQNALENGDKVADRFGGKGVISCIVDDALMPRTEDGKIVEIIQNPEGMPNRENGGQIIELDITALADVYLKVLRSGVESKVFDSNEAYEMIVDFIRHLSETQADYLDKAFDELNLTEDGVLISENIKMDFVCQIIEEDRIKLRLLPIQESVDIDKLDRLHKAFPFDAQQYLTVPIIDSNGKVRYVKSRRKVTVGYKYMYRMKQYGEEKFSVTSLSSTNIRNENSRSKASSIYKSTHPSTPVKIGDMEAEDISHASSEILILNLMSLALSPEGRRKVEELLIGDPYDVNISVPNDAKNRSVEQLNQYLKALGLEIVFDKRLKKFIPMTRELTNLVTPIVKNEDGYEDMLVKADKGQDMLIRLSKDE